MKKKYLITNYGCQMNYADSERFSGIIEVGCGYQKTDSLESADLIILNSCSIRQKAEDRVLGLGKKMLKLKSLNKNLKIVLTGCMARRTWAGTTKTGSPIQMTQKDREEQLKKTLPWLDFVIESKDFHKLPEKLGIKNQTEIKEYLSFEPILNSNFQAFVPISIGCDHFCTYCIVPFARGKEICRKPEDILKEVKNLIQNGYKDITLLGQTVNRWIAPAFDFDYKQGNVANTKIEKLNKSLLEDPKNESPKDFLQLLQVIDEIEGDYWLTFMSSHPNYMTSELIDFIGKSKHIRPYIHFALQSGSDNILQRMNRRYNSSEFKSIAKEMKEKIPGLGLSTDIIVGFPGETEEDLELSAKLMKELEFDMAYISEFSPRKGTAAGLIKDDISWDKKAEWKKYLNDEILAKTVRKNNEKMLGTIQKCLVEKDLGKGKYLARTANYKEVSFKVYDEKSKINLGDFVILKITKATNWALSGEKAS